MSDRHELPPNTSRSRRAGSAKARTSESLRGSLICHIYSHSLFLPLPGPMPGGSPTAYLLWSILATLVSACTSL